MLCDISVVGDYASQNAGEGTLYLMSHELGHYMGLRHIFDIYGGAGGINPATGQPRPITDAWDLIYAPGTSSTSPHIFFNSRTDAESFASANPQWPLVPIWQRADTPAPSGSPWLPTGLDHSCAQDSTNGIGHGAHCVLVGRDSSFNPQPGYSETFYPGDPKLKGIDMPMTSVGTDDESLRSELPQTAAVNAMSYYTDYSFAMTFSESQIEMMRQNLGYESSNILSSALYPAGQTTAPSYRTRLGTTTQYAPSGGVDFDGDGLRDIVFWRQPSSLTDIGHFTVLLSSHGFRQDAAEELQADLGGLGDTPVLADYTGDGITDFAVFRAGGGPTGDDPTDTHAYWKWCPSTHSTDCASFTQTLTFGTSDSVPLTQLNLDNNLLTPEIAVYHHLSSGQGVFDYTGIATSAVQPGTIQLGSSSAVPLPGTYDGDRVTDFAVYNRDTATFEMKLSSSGYTTDVVRNFRFRFHRRAGHRGRNSA